MIPEFTLSGVLPPFDPKEGPTIQMATSPYQVTILEVIERFSTSPERIRILQGLLEYRAELRAIGFCDGFQWLDGSFVENVEMLRNRPPKDIDLVTFSYVPVTIVDMDGLNELMALNMRLFDPDLAKEAFYCDAYFVTMDLKAEYIVSQTAYWFGLFTHQRETDLWKGILQVSLQDENDDVASKFLEEKANA